ncbi:retropepsin-like aspartic protease family protein [Hydrogenophaga defluvii]|uniref:TIGR02281 family clan AA aspartic protease n=1 Tax=Hydrogenophaga defluvii TaxID=249410 RepID=A0ABW2SFX7_9BURK
MPRLGAVLTWLVLAASPHAWAQAVQLAGLSSGKALLVINGEAPRFLSPGQTVAGVRLLSLGADSAEVDVSGERRTLRLGQAPIGMGQQAAPLASNRVVLEAGPGGHFVTAGQINGGHVQFMVDTGATVVSLGRADAERIGLKLGDGKPVQMNTANGAVLGYQVRLNSVKVGEATLYDVPAVVMPMPMPYVLLGNSFLSRFQLRRDNTQLILEKRY